MQQKFRSIRTKLIFILSLSALIAILLLATAMLKSTYTTLEDKAKISLENTAAILGQNLIVPLEFDDPQNAEQLLNTLKTNTSIDSTFVFKQKDEMFASYVKDGLDKEITQNKNQSLCFAEDITKDLYHKDKDHIVVSIPLLTEEEHIGTFCIVANTKDLNKTLKNQLLLTIGIALATFIIIVLLSMRLQKIFTEPLFRLESFMKQLAQEKDYSIQIENNYNDEFRFLFSGFKDMITKLQDSEDKQNVLIRELDQEKSFVKTLLDSQEQIIITTDGKTLLSANETFLDFYAVDDVEEFIQSYNAKCICETFNTDAPEGYLQIKMGEDNRETWIDYVISRSFGTTHKVMITRQNSDFIFSVTATKLPGKDNIKSAVFTDITEMENAKNEIEAINKHTKESIQYAALIQGALVPDNNKMRKYFKDQFVIWHPKDTVGGDIYLFEELRDSNEECLLMAIDCTGHGVPGAFVTMLVKAIERQITSKINFNPDEIVSPAKILSIFNKNMKQLLKQEDSNSISNAGFDGGIIYYNKKEKIIKYAGAETPLFYVEEDELKMIKGDRYSVGYKKCDVNYEYKEHSIKVKEGIQFYLTTDGYLDQNGGEKGFPFGKKSFKKIIEEYHVESMADQQEVFLNELDDYQGEEERNDDVTVIGLTV